MQYRSNVARTRAGAIRDTNGLIKMVADAKTEEVLGVAMIGNSAGEVIHEAAMGLRFHAKINDFIELLHVYPTMAEALSKLLQSHAAKILRSFPAARNNLEHVAKVVSGLARN